MRRTGKTTIIKQLLSDIPSKNKAYFDCENIADRELFSERNYDNIPVLLSARGFNIHEKLTLALDEIQLIPNLPSVIKYLYDHYHIKFLLTGSSSYYLKNLFTESLAGRKRIFELFPLDFGEFLTFKGVSYDPNVSFVERRFYPVEYQRLHVFYEEFIRFGGFPTVVLTQNDTSKKERLLDILNSYINIDIQLLADFRRKDIVHSLMTMLASRSGNRLDYAKLARLLGASPMTVKNYIDFFEDTYFLFRIPIFTRNPDKAIVKARKLYFSDTGLLNTLAEVSSGTQFENAVFTQLRQHGALHYYSLKNGKEIDFILNGNIALEVKETPSNMDMKPLRSLANHLYIETSRLVGRHQTSSFDDYIWGGEIR